ncbi:DUF938 domain-containing protein [Aestuariicella hydrocarbonica]|uniref:DUF938 domain-containing protein n=1 Tax=Pseudomaricurvus hydrocarbonicus TaxID=1470433 RepID=A0A9E5T4R5_9GAMM|nr:DUF938 domain-containing protein [Aestuariicella hydrocarbonica]NHO68209.1 DUF938 domain-containing protein [Aestuariicella hydrocarbonica]
MSQKPFSQACENNKAPILSVLSAQFTEPGKVLEIGSGTGQHAVFFARNLPFVQWQTSDLQENHAGITQWMSEYPGENLLPPIPLNVASNSWDFGEYDGVFTANTAHIMAWEEVLSMLAGVAKVLKSGGKLVIYGPFNYGGQFTSASNARFNEWLIEQAPHRAIRDFEAVCDAAAAQGLSFTEDCEMPANNRCLVFTKQ